MDMSRVPSFEKILAALDGQLLEGRIFQVELRKNRRFLLFMVLFCI